MTNWTLSTLRDRMSGRRHPALLVGMTLLLVATSALAQPPFEGRGDPRKDPFGESVFPPDLVMENQGEIDLGADQKQALIQELQRTQADLVPLQFEMSEAGERLRRLLDSPRVDETEALAAAGRVMQLESEIKTRHLLLVIRIKNLLTEEQQARLRHLRRRAQGPRHPRTGND